MSSRTADSSPAPTPAASKSKAASTATGKPSDAATRSESPSPEPTETPTPTPTPTPKPSPKPTPKPTPATTSSSDGAFDPVWYPDWTKNGGRGEAQPWPSNWPKPRIVDATGDGALSGRIILVDPGHNLGNSTHSSDINKRYWVGLEKICNTTGTETRDGYAEASYTYDVAQRLTELLTGEGATVVLTRDRNDEESYGPCIQGRGLLGEQVGADIAVSIHADGGPVSGHGAFVYTPATLAGYTSADKAARSVRLAKRILAGLDGQGLGGSTYLVPNIAPDREQGTLNTAGLPIVIVETLNMQNPDDSAIASSEEGRQRVAEGLAAGIAGYFSG